MPNLTPSQTAAYNALRSFINNHDPAHWAYTLKGYAGTGKSFTMARLIQDLVHDGVRVAVTAPTHQAVRVLGAMLPDATAGQTIQSLLSLKVKRQNGRERLVKASQKNHLEQFDLVIVDECSMVNAELFGYLEAAATAAPCKIILTGDPAQIPPVNANGDSPAFLLPGPMLTEVMRQAMDNPILAYCTALRQTLERGDWQAPLPDSCYQPDLRQGLHVMPGEAFTQFLHEAFVASDYDEQPNRFRVIAWTNAAVHHYNRTIQQLRYPHIGNEPFADGERVYLAEPLRPAHLIGSEGSTAEDLLENTETPARLTAPPSRAVHPLYPALPAWQITVETEQNTYELWTLDPSGQKDYDGLLKTLANQIKLLQPLKDAGKVPQSEPPSWWQWYQLRDAFATVRPAYAMTAHKSQGNTFENVFVDALDILKNPNRKEALQILYVACSRATHNLIINHGRT